uniref:Uncharacterized protein n=1 Tax=Candidatus Kentrum sp. MB TaxID=2138164 RepID=A0A450XT45_9GAMM|nr:MAG: hypothetical protein BECKMB1821G_GA0114241_102019 [Candidatus Kentron sp. MB]VFK32446.1 MAG: hypothetical protein BECKMB1821I_GA0114274_103324 [Candidatus Kentron sp. MB]VFK75914.1 MAG: hypothetical protein BECKMB1821H_GA0114242_103524 [Candidatus Kentron sp. MB]
MTLKTININCRILMTTLTELICCIHRNALTIIIFLHMTVNTTFQTIIICANPVIYSIIPLLI